MAAKRKTAAAEAEAEGRPKECGIVMPIATWADYSAQHWIDVKDIVERGIRSAELNPRPVWMSLETDIIQRRIVQNLYQCPVVVCDISGLNPNVMFELGMRLAFRKPTVIISDDSTRLPFDTGVIDTLIYPADLHFTKIERFIEDLSVRLSDLLEADEKGTFTPYLDTFGTFQVVEPPSDHVSFATHLEEKLDKVLGVVARLDRESADRKAASAQWLHSISDLNRLNFNPESGVIRIAGDPMQGAAFNWTKSREERLADLWKQGLTASEIASDLGTSRNAVIGKAHRLGLRSRGQSEDND